MKELATIGCLARYLADDRYDILSRMLELLCKNVNGVEPQDILNRINEEKDLNLGYDIVREKENYIKITSRGYDKTSKLCNSHHGRFEISIVEDDSVKHIVLNLKSRSQIKL